MEDILKSGLFGMALLMMLMIATVQIKYNEVTKTGTLEKDKVSVKNKVELANKEGIDIPL